MKSKLATAKWMSKIQFHLYNTYNTTTHTSKQRQSSGSGFDEIRCLDNEMSVEGMGLYLISEDKGFRELDDDKFTENYKIKDADNLSVLSYRWGFNTCTVTMTKNGKKIQGVEEEDTCLAIKLRVQDQLGFPVCNIKLFQQTRNSTEVRDYWHGRVRKSVIGMPDEKRPFSKRNVPQDAMYAKSSHLVAITVQELKIETDRIEEERKAREAMWAERRRANLEAAAEKQGLTAEEYEAQQAEERRRAEEARLERQRKIQAEKEEQVRIEEERKGRQAMRAEQQRANLEAAAAKAGLTVEEYEAEQARRAEEARLERQRQRKGIFGSRR